MFRLFRAPAALVALAALLVLPITSKTARASDSPSPDGGSGAPNCSKFKKGGKDWKRCMGQHSQDREDGYALGYWLAKTGEFDEALKVLRSVDDENDPRVMTMIGYTLRHLGRVDEGMSYYQKALALAPNMTNTRQYLGEAFLQINSPAQAKAQLAEIKARCGDVCEDYQTLAKEITAFERTQSKG